MQQQPNVSDIRIMNQSPGDYNVMNSSVQFIPDLNLENQQQNQADEIFSPKKEIVKKGILKTFYYQDLKRKKIIGCNIYVNEMNEQQFQLSKRGKICRICMGEEETSRFINPCSCKGSLMYVHEECLKLWILQKNGIEDVFKDKIKCELCSYKFRMKLEIHNNFLMSRFRDVPQHQKICWLIQIFIMFGIIGGIIGLFFKYSLSNIGVDAIMTLLIVLTLILIVYFIASFISYHQVEMIENWIISNYRPRRDTKHGSFFQLQSQMGQSIAGSPLSKRKTAQIAPQNFQPNSLLVIQVNQLMTSTNLSEQQQ